MMNARASEDMVQQFTEAIYAPDDIVEARLLPSRRSTWHRADCLPAATLLAENRRGVNIYVGANPRRARGIPGVKARDCTEAKSCGRCFSCAAMGRCLFVDWDDVGLDEARHRAKEAELPAPTVLLNSGGGVHAYWRLDNPIVDLALWSGHQKALIAAVQSDPAVHDAPRIMRLPGFLNLKYTPARECRIVEIDPKRTYPIDEFPEPKAETSRQPISPEAVTAYQQSGATALPARATLEFIGSGAPKGSRRCTLFKAACDLAGCGWLQSQAEAVLLPRALLLRQSDEDTHEWQARCEEQVRNAYARPRLPAREAARLSHGETVHGDADPRNGTGPIRVTLPDGGAVTFTRRPRKARHAGL